MTDEIKTLEEKINALMPELNILKKEFEVSSANYFKVRNEVGSLQNQIDAIKKKSQVELFKKTVGKGELLSFRSFFDEVRKGRDFSNKTVVWSFKNGKSGMYLNLWIRGGSIIKDRLLEKFHCREIHDTADLIGIIKEFPDVSFDAFDFDACTVASMVKNLVYRDKTVDDVFVFICDKKTLNDFDDISDTKGLYFFKSLPYVEKSEGKLKDGYLVMTCYGAGNIPKDHYSRYQLYPLETVEYRG